MRRINIIIAFATTLGLLSCSSKADSLIAEPFTPIQFNSYIETLPIEATLGEIIIQGSVTTSDSCGNFYNRMMIQDPTGAIELRVSFYDLYSLYRIDEIVGVMLRGMTLKKEDGMLYVNMGSLSLASNRILRQGFTESITPLELEIDEIELSQIGLLVRLSDGEFTQGGKGQWSGESTYKKGTQSIKIYTSPYASFADEILPMGKVSLTGIVTAYKDKIQLKLSSPDDCQAL